MKTPRVLTLFVLAVAPLAFAWTTRADPPVATQLAVPDADGELRTIDVNGAIDLTNPFFQDLGTNGRRCITCHQPADAWTITPANVQRRFVDTDGNDPIFQPNDGSDCEGVDRLHGSRAAAHTMLLSKGLIRIGIDVPVGAEFEVVAVDDPHHCGAPLQSVSMYRRPLTPDMPLYTLMNIATGDTVQTTDPGRAMITGKWADVAKLKGPVLRGLAGRAPYFHNGSAATLSDVVDFYDQRFGIGFTPQEQADLVAFLKAL